MIHVPGKSNIKIVKKNVTYIHFIDGPLTGDANQSRVLSFTFQFTYHGDYLLGITKIENITFTIRLYIYHKPYSERKKNSITKFCMNLKGFKKVVKIILDF